MWNKALCILNLKLGRSDRPDSCFGCSATAFLPYNTIWIFGKRKKSHADKYWESGRVWNNILFVLSKKYTHRQRGWMGRGHKFYSNPTRVLTPFQDALKWAKWNFYLVANSQVIILLFLSTFSFIKHMFSSVLLVSGRIKHFLSSAKVTLPLNLENHSVTCVLSTVYSPEQLQHLKSFHIIFSKFKAKFDVWTLFFQVCHFVGLSKSQREQHTIVLNKTLLNSHTCYHPIPSRKWTWQILLYPYLAVDNSIITFH